MSESVNRDPKTSGPLAGYEGKQHVPGTLQRLAADRVVIITSKFCQIFYLSSSNQFFFLVELTKDNIASL
jgi:hypothetical protein